MKKFPSEDEIVAAVKRDCQPELEKFLESDREPLVRLLALFVETPGMSRETEKMLLRTHRTRQKLSARLENLTKELRAFLSSPPYLSPNAESLTGRTLLGMEVLARSMKKEGVRSENYVWRYGRTGSNIGRNLVAWLLQRDQGFNRWKDLSRLIEVAFLAGGLHITADLSSSELSKAANCYRHRRPLKTKEENKT